MGDLARAQPGTKRAFAGWAATRDAAAGGLTTGHGVILTGDTSNR